MLISKYYIVISLEKNMEEKIKTWSFFKERKVF